MRAFRPLLLTGWLGLLAAPSAPAASAPAAPAPPAAAPRSPGEIIELAALDLESHRGRVVYVDFWASWCAPCLRSFPWLSELQETHRERGLVVIGVNVDRERSRADAFLENRAPPFGIVFDPEGNLASEYDLKGMPSSYLYDRTGELRRSHVGFRESDAGTIEAEIRELLGEDAP